MYKKIAAISLALVLSLSLSGCFSTMVGFSSFNKRDSKTTVIKGNNEIEEKTFALTDKEYNLIIGDVGRQDKKRNSVGITTNIDYTLDKALVIKGDSNILSIIDVTVDEDRGTISIDTEDFVVFLSDKVTITIGANLKSLDVDGFISLDLKQGEVKNFDLKVDGVCDGILDFKNVENLTTNVDGASNLELSGTATSASFNADGAVNIEALDLKAKHVTVDVDGAGNVEVYATDTLNASVDGVGAVKYKGNPKEKNVSVQGIGSVSEME